MADRDPEWAQPVGTVDEMLTALERDVPRLLQDMDTFYPAFEERACAILGLEDSPRVEARLDTILRKAGLASD